MKAKLLGLLGLMSIPNIVSAISNTTVDSTIMGKDAFGLLINLHIQDYVPTAQAIMYYNYISLLLIVVWSAFSSQYNESRYTFTTPLIAALFVWLGWLRAPDAVAGSYWGAILLCIVLGAFMYMNDMNHEKSGLPGVGNKLLTVAMMIMCFTGAFGFIQSQNILNTIDNANSGASQNIMCGKSFTCDANGNVDLSVSATSISSAGGAQAGVISAALTLGNIALSIIIMAIAVVSSVLFFAVVVLAAYPDLAASPMVVAFLALMNVVMWGIYFAAFFGWFSGRVTGTDV